MHTIFPGVSDLGSSKDVKKVNNSVKNCPKDLVDPLLCAQEPLFLVFDSMLDLQIIKTA